MGDKKKIKKKKKKKKNSESSINQPDNLKNNTLERNYDNNEVKEENRKRMKDCIEELKKLVQSGIGKIGDRASNDEVKKIDAIQKKIIEIKGRGTWKYANMTEEETKSMKRLVRGYRTYYDKLR